MDIEKLREYLDDTQAALNKINSLLPKAKGTKVKKPVNRLIVTFSDGVVFDFDTAVETFYRSILKLGVDRVHNEFPHIVCSEQPEYGFRKVHPYYIRTGGPVGDTGSKRRYLKKISDTLGVGLKVETVQK